MAITYAQRVAIQQGDVITLRMASIASLNPASASNFNTQSTWGARGLILGSDYTNSPPAFGAASSIGQGTITSNAVDRSSIDLALQPIVGLGNVAIGNDIIARIQSLVTSPPANTFWYTKTTMPTDNSGTAEIFHAINFTVPGAWIAQEQSPPMPILNGLGQLRACGIVNAAISDATSGAMMLIDAALMSANNEAKWLGYDSVIGFGGYGGNLGMRPKNSGAGNWLLFSGVYLGTGTRPLLIDANLAGTENGRFNIKLDNPIWDAVLNQPVGSHNVFQISPCNEGWVAPFNISAVTPPSFILFNEDMSQYWIYVLIAEDQAALNAILNPLWGKVGTPAIFLGQPLTGAETGSNFFMVGAGLDANAQSTIFANIPTSKVLLPPFAPYVPLQCVPCAPMQLAGGSWVGKVGGG